MIEHTFNVTIISAEGMRIRIATEVDLNRAFELMEHAWAGDSIVAVNCIEVELNPHTGRAVRQRV